MDRYRIEGRWNQLKGRLKEMWGDLFGGDFDKVEGRRDQFVGQFQVEYGLARERTRSGDARRPDAWR